MSDQRLRALERRWKETGDPDDEAAYLLERLRSGDLSRSALRCLAYRRRAGALRAVRGDPDFKLDEAQFDELLRELTVEAVEDEVGVWLIVHLLRERFGISEPDTLRAAALGCVEGLLATGKVVARQYRAAVDEHVLLARPAEAIVVMIDEEWARRGRDPDIGEIVDFVRRP